MSDASTTEPAGDVEPPRTEPARTPLVRVLDQIRRTAGLPLELGETLPPAAYSSPELYDLEVERIFRREWLCVARADQIPRPGDYLALDVLTEPIVITRDEDGALHALSRVCRHRFMDVLPPGHAPRQGNLSRLTCPYHTWTYRLDGRFAGQLTGAPLMHKVDFDRANCRLPLVRLAVWNGFVLINLDADASPPRLDGPAGELAAYGLDDWVTAEPLTWTDVAANWKVAAENGAESYHHLGTHAATLQPLLPGQATQITECGENWFSMRNPLHPDAALNSGFPPVPGLSPEQRSGLLITGVFPTFVLTVMPDHAAWFRWLPTGPATHETQIAILTPGTTRDRPDYQEVISTYRAFYHQVQTEDLLAIHGVQRGLASTTSHPGRLSHLERPIWQFQRYLAKALTDRRNDQTPPAGDSAGKSP
ncbi:aromatic ring-hydroxylating dioxygenase subunit alpha [Actinomadura sp. 9N215]|uniref:aromatic ring-hydroxylating dioxygenase subunit alpha n=1 Tax=Actinomadura sp. 9N215 TaxID=3375150 RepID=UPI0037B5BDF5